MDKIKRLFFDIETSPNIGTFWSAGHKQQISYDNIIKERSIICISYKWAHSPKVHSLTWDKEQNDKSMLQKFMKVASAADEVVGHNSDRFDLPWFRTRCLFHKLDPLPNYTSVDTLKKARAYFKFNSNRLDYIAKYLGLKGKVSTSYDLWKDVVLKNNRTALVKMVKYCENDVILLEKVYDEISKYVPNNVHHGVANGHSKVSCPHCASKNMIYSKRRITATGIEKIQLQCDDCGKYSTVSKKAYESR